MDSCVYIHTSIVKTAGIHTCIWVSLGNNHFQRLNTEKVQESSPCVTKTQAQQAPARLPTHVSLCCKMMSVVGNCIFANARHGVEHHTHFIASGSYKLQ